jgi:ligand-binding sensor domain-containing protein
MKYARGIIVIILSLCAVVSPLGCANTKVLPDGWLIVPHLNAVQAIAVQGNTIWAGCENGVYGIDRQTGAVIQKLKSDPPLTYVKALLVDKTGVLYIGQFNGLTRYDGTSCETFTTKDGLPDNRVNTLLLDNAGRLWAGTWGGAAYRENGAWHVVTEKDGLGDNMVNVMFQDNQGGMWFGSYVAPRGGISYMESGRKWQLFSSNNGLPHDDITSIIQDQSGSVWAGTGFLYRGGAVKFGLSSGSWVIQQVLTKSDGLAGDKVRSVFQDKDGVLWFGSEYDGLARWENGKWRVLTEKDGMPHYEVMAMLQDVDGSLWMGTQNGVVRFNSAALKALR